MLVFGKSRRIAINCRCGKRTVWNISEDVKYCIDNHLPLVLERTGEGNHTILKVDECYFECQCGTLYGYSSNGLRNVTRDAECTETAASVEQKKLFDTAKTVSKMVN